MADSKNLLRRLDGRVTNKMLHELAIQVCCCPLYEVNLHARPLDMVARTEHSGGGSKRAGRASLVQAGPVVRVTLPKLKPDSDEHRGYGFAQYTSLVRSWCCMSARLMIVFAKWRAALPSSRHHHRVMRACRRAQSMRTSCSRAPSNCSGDRFGLDTVRKVHTLPFCCDCRPVSVGTTALRLDRCSAIAHDPAVVLARQPGCA